MADDPLSGYHDLAQFQFNVANNWFTRAEKSKDVFAKFLFYYIAFNALTYLWGVIDDTDRTDLARIKTVVHRLGSAAWEKMSSACCEQVAFFACGREPIASMNKRERSSPSSRDARDGRKSQRTLRDPSATPDEKLKAITFILYLVRCNLAHGSKSQVGDDRDVIENAVPLIRELSGGTIAYTKGQSPGLG